MREVEILGIKCMVFKWVQVESDPKCRRVWVYVTINGEKHQIERTLSDGYNSKDVKQYVAWMVRELRKNLPIV